MMHTHTLSSKPSLEGASEPSNGALPALQPRRGRCSITVRWVARPADGAGVAQIWTRSVQFCVSSAP